MSQGAETELRCQECHEPLAGDDAFCGNCGTAVRSRPQTASGATRPAAAGQATGGDPGPAAGGRFFGHPQAGGTRRTDPLSNATRYLCAAAYLDPTFANTVIGELLGTHRAVVPSDGLDLVPIIRHCLNARRMQLVRDVVVSLLLLAGLVLATLPTIAIVIISFFLGFLPGAQWERRSFGKMFLAGIGAVAGLIVIGGVWAVVVVLGHFGHGVPQLGPLASGPGVIIGAVIFAGLIGGTLGVYYYSAYHILGQRLGPNATVGEFDRAAAEAERRIAEISVAQRGNVTLYAGENPFVGAGTRGRVWSIAIELDRAHPAGSNALWREPGGYVPIDPVELHQALRKRLLGLKDPELPANERIAALTVTDHVVGEGQRRWESPLIDPSRKIPYSLARQEAVQALVRHPQAGMRYYQRVCVSDEGQAVWVDGEEVIGPADQEVGISAFIYVAVEGRMFYLEFVPATLPPILHRYHVIDQLPKVASGKFAAKVLLQTASSAFTHIIGAPLGVLSTALRIWYEHKSFREEFTSSQEYLFGDVGARLSVRELGAGSRPHTYIQRLDAAKYTRIIERLVTDTVLDFLVAKGVDTAAYRASMTAVINNGVVISGGAVTGPVAAGAGAEAHQHATAPGGPGGQ